MKNWKTTFLYISNQSLKYGQKLSRPPSSRFFLFVLSEEEFDRKILGCQVGKICGMLKEFLKEATVRNVGLTMVSKLIDIKKHWIWGICKKFSSWCFFMLEIQVIFTDIDPHLACLKVSKTLAWIKVSQSLSSTKTIRPTASMHDSLQVQPPKSWKWQFSICHALLIKLHLVLSVPKRWQSKH